MERKSYYWLVSVMLIGTFMFFGCSSSGSGGGTTTEGPTLTDYATGPMMSVPAVKADGSKTVLPATADVHGVKTDGDWVVWTARTINLGYFDGANLQYLDTGLAGSVTPWAFGDHEDAPVAFDGTTVAFVARDVATGVVNFFYMTPGSAAKSIALPATIQDTDMDEFIAYVSGTLAVVASDSAEELYRADLSDASPAFEELIISSEPRGAIGKYLAVINDGFVEIYDMTGAVDQTPVILIGDDDGGTDPSDLDQANGFFTWVEDGMAYYFEPGVDSDSAAIYGAGSGQSDPVAGPDYFLWEEGGSLMYLADGEDTPEAVGYDASAEDVRTGDGFFAYIDQDDDGDDQIFIYSLDNLDATEGVQVSANGEDALEEDAWIDGDYQSIYFQVDGTKIYDVFEYRDAHNPSRVAVMYDVATATLKEIGKDAFQQAGVLKAAGGKAVLLHRDHSFRLIAKKAAEAGKPVVLTPPNMRVDKYGQFSVADGIVAFCALDRNRYLDNPALMDQVGDNDELAEIYYIDLNSAGSIVRVTDNLIEEEYNPRTDGMFITWSEDSGDDPSAWGYDIAGGTTTKMGPCNGYRVSVDGGIAAWKYYNSDSEDYELYYYNLNAGNGGMIPDANADSCPDIADGLITWNDEDSYHPHYYDLNAATPAVVDIYETEPAYFNSLYGQVNTDGRFITWQEERSGWDPGTGAVDVYVIVVHDTSGGTTSAVPAADYSQINNVCSKPQISDGIVIFAAEEYGVENPDGDKEIFFYNLKAASPVLVRLTDDAEGAGKWDSRVSIANGLAVWRTGGSSSWDWKGRTVAAAYVD